jgi:hypothetical protein
VQEERVHRMVGPRAEARLAHAEVFLRAAEIADVLQRAELPQRPPELVPAHVPLAVHDADRAVGADHPVFDVVPWPAAHRRGRLRAIVRMNDAQPALLPLRQLDRCTPKIRPTSSESDT